MTSPASKEELSKVLGLLTYLSSYIPNVSAKSEPLRALLKKDVPFIWEPEQEHYLNKLKTEITNNTTLPFYNPKLPLTIEVDASTKGLGAALIQNEKPIAFASKALTKPQTNYSSNRCQNEGIDSTIATMVEKKLDVKLEEMKQ